MPDRESAADIEAQAARWVVRMDRHDSSAELRDELNVWLSMDPRRKGAYFRAAAAWEMLNQTGELGEQAPHIPQVAPHRPARATALGLSRRQMFGLMTAAAAGAAVVVGPGVLDPRYATVVGEIRRVPLKDGSTAVINTDTSIEVSLRSKSRRVKLKRGEAWFEVAKDAKRPFTVESGPVRVRALGTGFSVRRLETGCEVLVTEGSVEVWSDAAVAGRLDIAAGGRAFVSDAHGAHSVQAAGPAMTRELAWREGQIILEGEMLGDAVRQFNRYSRRNIIVNNPALEREQLVGWFRTDDPEGFVRAAAASLGAEVIINENNIIIQR